MEQKRKIGGESLRNEDAMKKDMISELPEALLLHILSSVPTKAVIATSVLSKRWRSLWKMLPKLELYFEHDSSEDVYRLLILHKAPILESLHLSIEDKSARLDIRILIGIAFSRHVRELVLSFCHEDQHTVRFPSVLCSYNDTLEVLKLTQHILLDFPSRVCFKSLRELHLYYVEFDDEASVCNLLSGCPRLQDLVVERHSNFDVETYTITVPSLQRLTIEEDSSQDMDGGGYVINAPSLKYLNIEGLYRIDFCLIENAPELVEAKIGDVSDIANENILASLILAKRLSFYFPLERYREECPVGWEWNQPKRVPECLLLHLETLVWTRYGWQREDEKQVATYILKNARQLKKATFDPKYVEPEELEKRREMLDVLASVARASTSSHLVFEPVDL
ncbi:FBD-associated F-box protein At3g49020-like isoform X2 [Raphanus sativus]|uniref:FBD-associated F-box protein At3g49020-like isoform X2 n=1 Tax=Raphanus sativus TaxID=3726 RepID=A0A9W3DIL3_RAPSA|nr:FBD-associated F-box protein At3g49020-like isoform X2 [Raphanus sativus]